MDAQKDIIQVVREACGKKVVFLPHAIRQMSRVDRMITTPEVHMVIDNGEVIEDYPEDVRGHSCLVLGCGEDMKCIYCKGEMVRKTAPFHIDRKGYHLLFDAIPAWVCGQCGEAYFEEAEVDAIQEVLRKIDKETEKLVVAN